jgi:hypothetical protein
MTEPDADDKRGCALCVNWMSGKNSTHQKKKLKIKKKTKDSVTHFH